MKQIKIPLSNFTFNGKYQKLWFVLFDFMDFIHNPFCFVLENNITIKNFALDPYNYKIGSSKFEFTRIIWKADKEHLNIGNK